MVFKAASAANLPAWQLSPAQTAGMLAELSWLTRQLEPFSGTAPAHDRHMRVEARNKMAERITQRLTLETSPSAAASTPSSTRHDSSAELAPCKDQG